MSSSSDGVSELMTSVVSAASVASGTVVIEVGSLSDSDEASCEEDTPKKVSSVGSKGVEGVASASAAGTSSEGLSTVVLDASAIVAVCESDGGAAIQGTVTCSLTASSAAETHKSEWDGIVRAKHTEYEGKLTYASGLIQRNSRSS